MNKQLRVLIGSPINQQPNILKKYLNSLRNIQCDDFEVDFYFIDDNDDVMSTELLNNFTKEDSGIHVYKSNSVNKDININYKINSKHKWNEELVLKVADMKNQILKYAQKENYDYVFLIDSDIIIHPHTLTNLLEQKKDLISEIIWTKYNKAESVLPQVWLYDNYILYEIIPRPKSRKEMILRANDFVMKLKKPGIYKVGGVGGCILISKYAINKGVSFKKIQNVSYLREDRHFCIRASVLGFSLYVDTHLPALHLYENAE